MALANKSGLFGGYKSICKKLSDLIRAYNPNYPHPNALVSTVMLASLQQVFYAQHLPSLTSFKGNVHNELYVFIRQLVFSAIKSRLLRVYSTRLTKYQKKWVLQTANIE